MKHCVVAAEAAPTGKCPASRARVELGQPITGITLEPRQRPLRRIGRMRECALTMALQPGLEQYALRRDIGQVGDRHDARVILGQRYQLA